MYTRSMTRKEYEFLRAIARDLAINPMIKHPRWDKRKAKRKATIHKGNV